MKFSIISEVKNGNLISNRKRIQEIIQSFEGKRVEVSIEKAKKKRSTPQNNYYWGCVIPILRNALKDTGNLFSEEQVHDLLKFKFLKEDVRIHDDGEFITRIKSTTELTTSEFMDFKVEIQRWSAEFLGINIPDPMEQCEFQL